MARIIEVEFPYWQFKRSSRIWYQAELDLFDELPRRENRKDEAPAELRIVRPEKLRIEEAG